MTIADAIQHRTTDAVRYEALADSLAKVDAQEPATSITKLEPDTCNSSQTGKLGQEEVGDADPDALARLEDHWLHFMVRSSVPLFGWDL